MGHLGLLEQPDYLRLWAAQIIAEAGSRVGSLALSLTAVLALEATAGQMGALRAATNAPALLFGLMAGVGIDRWPRRRALVIAELGRAALLGSIPLLLWLGWLRVEVLYVVTFAVGALALIFDIGSTTYLPMLVDRSKLVEANSKLQLGQATASTIGPGVGGWLIQAVSAPLAMLVSVLSFLISGLLWSRVREVRAIQSARSPQGIWRDIRDGVAPLVDDPLLRATTATAAIGAFGTGMQEALFVLFATVELGLSPTALGLVVATGGAAAIFGAATTGPLTARIGTGPALITGQALVSGSFLLIPAAGLALAAAPLLLAVGQVLAGIGMRVFSINQVSLRQAITDPGALGRVNAARRFLVFGIQPVGALCGGLLGSVFGLGTTLVIAAFCVGLAVLPLLWSPIPGLRQIPGPDEYPLDPDQAGEQAR